MPCERHPDAPIDSGERQSVRCGDFKARIGKNESAPWIFGMLCSRLSAFSSFGAANSRTIPWTDSASALSVTERISGRTLTGRWKPLSKHPEMGAHSGGTHLRQVTAVQLCQRTQS